MKQLYTFKINPKAWEALKNLRGWPERGAISLLAKTMGLGRSYVSQCINGSIPVTHEFMSEFISACGANPNESNEWARLFVVDIQIVSKKSYQTSNMAKYKGLIPYNEGQFDGTTSSGNIRRNDKITNLDRISQEPITPAWQYYERQNRRT